ncbi:peptidyl-prolyl cis-trans isomerase, partial [Craterilacuibacter sp.]|uniref:peptidyl-prolyl cis-trans isomerase n=1 Tax=Craterilacuibacter sp. TaxID=2870909 RepID=UPI003F3C9607
EASSLTVGSEELRRVIASIPAFQQDGKFSPARYKEFLAERYMSPAALEARVLQDITLQSQLLPYTGSHFVSRTVAARMAGLLGETRDVQAMVLRPQAFEGEVKLDEAALKAYYDANKARFLTPEAVKLDYVVLSQEALAAKVEVSDAEVRKYFDEHAAEFASEERRVSHVLLLADKNAKPEVKAKVKAEAEALLKQLRANPAGFAALAKSRSQDPGSAGNGGDLGFFGRGAMVKPFEDVAFSMKPGQISEVVATDFGYHILKLDEIKKPDFEAAKPQIIQLLKKQKSVAGFRAAAEKLADLAYQHGESLKAITDALGLPVEKSALLVRGKPGEGLAANPKLLEAAFSDDVLKKKHNSEPVDVGNNTLVVARVAELQPAHQQTLAEVSPLIRTELLQKDGAKLAQEKGAALLAELKAGKGAATSGWGEVVAVSRRASQGLPLADLRALFAAPVKVLPSYAGVKRDNGDYVIYRINQLVPAASANPAEQEQLAAVIGEMSSNALVSSYLEGLRQQYPVTLSQQPSE